MKTWDFFTKDGDHFLRQAMTEQEAIDYAESLGLEFQEAFAEELSEFDEEDEDDSW